MSVKTLTSSNIQNTGKTRSIFASTGIPGFGFMAGDFESIATVTVGSGGAANIEFTNIPGTYQHLQLRMIARFTGNFNAGAGGFTGVQFNADTGSNYVYHHLLGDGSSASTTALTSQSQSYLQRFTTSGETASIFGASVVDLLDYCVTTKNKTIRSVGGFDRNGGGRIYLASGLWMSTNAVTSIKLLPEQSTNFAEHTTAALYGVRAP